ncbi:hypothetical protein Cni_G04952 [Canna indica]|uniref:C2H2-type domain-containing protein n=1 Tax=Canna indica TaxID=4628 RepID=A0AAQ3JY49_9LILI|nr:hypothetical protein Cni_G04952 [Canna indica]
MISSSGRKSGQRPTGSIGGGEGEPRSVNFVSPDSRFLPLLNLSTLGNKMDALRRFLSESIDRRDFIGGDQLQMVSSEIVSAVQEIILNGAALLANSQSLDPALFSSAQSLNPFPRSVAAAADSSLQSAAITRIPDTRLRDPRSNQLGDDPDPPSSELIAVDAEDCDIVEIDTAELMTEHVHFCEICGKGFKRDANLRMHMRAHGDRFKTLEALLKPDRDVRLSDGREATSGRRIRFSCPYPGCNRNRAHKKFRPLKSAACVKNHFKRSHCPKMYSCHRCNKKSFSVVADLKSHLKHCGENRWRCSCGTSFSRKDKLFAHVALFEGHMPSVEIGAKEEIKKKDVILEEEPEVGGAEKDDQRFEPELFKGLMEDFQMGRGNWRGH